MTTNNDKTFLKIHVVTGDGKAIYYERCLINKKSSCFCKGMISLQSRRRNFDYK